MNAQTAVAEAEAEVPTDLDLLRRTLTAHVYDVAHETPLQPAALLSAHLGNQVLLKREDQQPVFSFKLRGAYNKMVALTPTERARGVIAASAGNHAQGVALAAAKLGLHAVIVMPVTAPCVKIDAVRRLGGDAVEIVLAGDSYSDAHAAAARIQLQRRLIEVPPFDDIDVIAGQATIGMEILRQYAAPHAVFVPVGGGGLLAGIASYVKTLAPQTRVIGVEAADSDAMARSLEAGRRVALSEVGLFSDGTAVKQVGALTLALCRRHVDAMIRVHGDALCSAIRDVYRDTRSVPEPAGALAVAGLKQYVAAHDLHDEDLVAVVSGANMDFDRLRFIAERAELGDAREAIFAVTIPEERGSFRRFCATLGRRAITEFNYRIGDAQQAHLFVGIRTSTASERALLASGFQAEGFAVLDLTCDELAKQHLRHMVGGRSPLARDERLYRFEFPERPGALTDFLDQLHPHWNISLFHYRNQGADYGRIVVGIQVSDDEHAAFQRFLSTLGYPHADETANPAYRLLLCA